MDAAPFQGQALQTLATAGVLVSENAYAAGSTLPPHVHHHAFLSLTLSGGYVERHGARAVAYGPGSIAFHPPGEEHAVAIGASEVRCLNVELSAAWAGALGRSRRPFVRAVGGPLAWLAHGLHREARGAASAVSIESTVLEMLGILGASSAPTCDRLPPRWLGEAEEILRAEYRTGLSATALAARVGVHPVHLSRTWRRFRRCSLGEAQRRLRVDEARRRIAAGGEALVDVALDVGFADQAHFTRVFRRVTGVTPSAYGRRERRPC
jgi:AraC family transcriptional regulator